jgi:hypothetical protein
MQKPAHESKGERPNDAEARTIVRAAAMRLWGNTVLSPSLCGDARTGWFAIHHYTGALLFSPLLSCGLLHCMPLPEFKTWLEVIEFDDFDSLTDEELLDLFDLQIDALVKIKTINPAITDEMIQNFKKGVSNFEMACYKEKEALKAVAISKQKLDASLDNLLAHPDLPNGKPLPIMPKIKGN